MAAVSKNVPEKEVDKDAEAQVGKDAEAQVDIEAQVEVEKEEAAENSSSLPLVMYIVGGTLLLAIIVLSARFCYIKRDAYADTKFECKAEHSYSPKDCKVGDNYKKMDLFRMLFFMPPACPHCPATGTNGNTGGGPAPRQSLVEEDNSSDGRTQGPFLGPGSSHRLILTPAGEDDESSTGDSATHAEAYQRREPSQHKVTDPYDEEEELRHRSAQHAAYHDGDDAFAALDRHVVLADERPPYRYRQRQMATPYATPNPINDAFAQPSQARFQPAPAHGWSSAGFEETPRPPLGTPAAPYDPVQDYLQWDEKWNESYGTYWRNKATNQIARHRPACLTLSMSWATARDPATDRTYYYNIDTRESQWEHPGDLDD